MNFSNLIAIFQNLARHFFRYAIAVSGFESHHSVDSINQAAAFGKQIETVLGGAFLNGIVADDFG